MNKVLTVSALLLFASAFAQTAAPITPTAPITPAVVPAPAAPTLTPPVLPKQVHIVVGEFQCAAYSCNGQALADALTNALVQAGNFAVYERSALNQGVREGFISGADAGSQVIGADVLVLGTISAYGQEAGSGNFCVFGLCGGSKKERVAANLRIFDVKTSRIIGTAQVEGTNTGAAGSINVAGLQFGGSQNSGLDKAVAVMLNDAVQKLSATIPAAYYH